MSGIIKDGWHDHLTGEASREEILSKLRREDLSHLEELVIPTIREALRLAGAPAALFIVGSLADLRLPTYRDVDLHVVPHDSRRDAHSISEALEAAFARESRLATHEERTLIPTPDGGDFETVLFTGVEARVLGIPRHRFQGAYFEILAPQAWMFSYPERLVDEQRRGNSFCVWNENI